MDPILGRRASEGKLISARPRSVKTWTSSHDNGGGGPIFHSCDASFRGDGLRGAQKLLRLEPFEKEKRARMSAL